MTGTRAPTRGSETDHRVDGLHEATAGAHPPVEGIVGAIGHTPLVRMRQLLGTMRVDVWAKLEMQNPGGSSKARPAARMILDALRAGELAPGHTVIESSSGNMAIGLAQVCRFYGLRLICVLDSRTNSATVRTLRALGVDVRVVTEPDPETGELLTARLNEVAMLAERTPNSFCPDQYANPANPAAHADGTMREIDEALDGRIDYLLVAAGTAGTLLGCADYLRDHGRRTRFIAVDSDGSALFGGKAGHRRLPGHGAGVESAHSRRLRYDRLVRVSDLDCVIGCRRLLEREAVFAGASSGAVVFALQKLASSFEPGARCAIVLADGGAGYLDTVYDDAWVARETGCSAAELMSAIAELPGVEA
jgi:N-(2-amino-2-carboxyethyl)-L-glutamate synthase